MRAWRDRRRAGPATRSSISKAAASSPDEARGLLTRAFVADALDRIGEEAVREAFYADAEALVRRLARDNRRAVMDMATATRPLDWRCGLPGDPGRLGLSGQRRHRAEAEAGDRRDHARLCRDLCDRASRRLPALGGDDGGVRGLAQTRRAASSTRRRPTRSSSSAARPRGSTWSRRAGAGQSEARRPRAASPRSSIIRTSSRGSWPAPSWTSCR